MNRLTSCGVEMSTASAKVGRAERIRRPDAVRTHVVELRQTAACTRTHRTADAELLSFPLMPRRVEVVDLAAAPLPVIESAGANCWVTEVRKDCLL